MEELIIKNEITKNKLNINIFDKFIQFIDASPSTVESYKKQIRQFFYFLTDNDIIEPTREDILKFKEYLIQDGKKATTIQSYITVIKIFFRFTAAEGLYPNIADKIKGVRISKEHKKDYLTSQQLKEIINTLDKTSIKGKRDYALFVLMVTCGLRDIEISRANVEDLRVLGDNTVLYIHGKGRTDKTEYVKVQPIVEKAIRSYLNELKLDKTSPLFINLSNKGYGSRITTRSVSRVIKNILVNANYDSDRLTAHSLRHTAVTLSLIAGASLQETQQFARHSNIATTQIYAHNLERANNKCSELIASSIFN